MEIVSCWFTVIVALAFPFCMGQDDFGPSDGLPELLPSSDDFQDFCDTFTPDDFSSIPSTLSRQFSLHVEANILNENRTLWVHEFFDDVNNRGSVTFVQDGVRERVILDYANNEVFVLPDPRAGTECSVYPLAETRVAMVFGITTVNGSAHIGSARTFLENLNDDTPIQYVGLDSVRGIPTLRWQACTTMGNVSLGGGVSLVADYYFSSADWTYATVRPEDSSMVLAQIVVRGNSMFNNTLRTFYHVYSVFGFHSGPDAVPDRAFSVPTGTACVGRNEGIPVPEIPPFFSTYIQYVVSGVKQVTTIREYYDFVHQLFRLDVYYDGQMGGAAGPYQFVHDFESQLQYIINRHDGSCNITTLSQPFLGDVELDEEGNANLISPRTIFFQHKDLNYSYEGVSTVRGVEVDSWIASPDFFQFNAVSNITNGVFEIFFTRPGYNITTDRSAGASVVLWRIIVSGEVSNAIIGSVNVSYEMDFFDFSTSEPPYDVFDVSVCFDPEESHTLLLLFEVPRLGIDFSTFRTNLRASLVNATGLRPVQVNNIRIVSDNGSHIFVALHFTNLSALAQTNAFDVIVTADEALESLRSSGGGPLPFQVDVSNGVKVSPTLFSANRGRNPTTCDVPTNETCNATCDMCPTDATGAPSTISTIGEITDSPSIEPMTSTPGSPTGSIATSTDEPASTTAEPASTTAEPASTTGAPSTIGGITDSPPMTSTPGRPTGSTAASTDAGKTTDTGKPASTTAEPCKDNITNRLKLTDGVVAGIAVGLFFVGFLGALLMVCICYMCLKCCGGKGSLTLSSVKYQKQDDELETFS